MYSPNYQSGDTKIVGLAYTVKFLPKCDEAEGQLCMDDFKQTHAFHGCSYIQIDFTPKDVEFGRLWGLNQAR
ncbi:hypothetical protein BU25DRAFT_411186 [Macroventuria anomochaeta]|uniref:Uncharacterized protein n=1 Tax=Macroventuria anomochaeta TaxID=301207 RepID=A0ACB6S0R5_9PLEO|nr:uncharacterized protein BU25DRAFT_411186 [Macroventuria anomochaeta]KAF2627102.1 hypothetical protein BU25DRAFT_411186 [Macroventuria anomochaeta]